MGVVLVAFGLLNMVLNKKIAYVMDNYYEVVWGRKQSKQDAIRLGAIGIGLISMWEGIRILLSRP